MLEIIKCKAIVGNSAIIPQIMMKVIQMAKNMDLPTLGKCRQYSFL